MTSKVANKLTSKYIYIGDALTIVLLIAIQFADQFYSGTTRGLLFYPSLVSAIFSILSIVVIGMIWRKIVVGSPDMLPTFFTSVSGFRMLAALFTMFACYMVVGRDAMAEYIVVFMIFYLVNLAFHAIYFSRINNKNDK